MRPVYAVQFEVRPGGPAKSPSPSVSVRDAVAAWVQHWYTQWRETDVVVPISGGMLEPEALHRIEVLSTRATTGESLWSLVWSYPAESDENLLWQSSVTVAEAEDVTEVGVVVRIASREFRILPMSYNVRRPYVVKRMLETLPCFVSGRHIGASPHSVGVEDVGAFEAWCIDSDRRLPIVLFSRDPYTDQCLVSPGRVSDVLAGLAYVYVLNDKWAGFRLTSAMGRPLACFNGAVRIYWPGLVRDGSAEQHKLFLPDEVRQLAQDFGDHLIRRIAPISALRMTELGSARKARTALETDRAREAQQTAEQIKAGTLAKEQVEEEFLRLVDDRDIANAARVAAEDERDGAQLRVMELEEENAQLKENLRAISAYRPSAEASPPPVPEQPDPETVRAALDLAAITFSDHLIVWASAERSADKSAFARPTEIYEALMALGDLAHAHFRAKREGRSVGAWEEWFERRGFKYAAKESQNTLNMYGDDRDFTHKGEKRRMLRHLTIGGGDRTNCVQIYFDVDEARGRFVVGYCGVHLPYYGMRT